ncbi:MAG: TonB-dependent receptor plug domain-containing protein, partial [Opitutaceae bacterium]
MRTHHAFRIDVLPVVAAALLSPVLAQTAPPPIPSPGVVELSPFTVTESSEVGYLASNTLAGSRFNTPLSDTPAAISVLTPEFPADIGAFTLTEAMNYAVNVERQLDDDRAAINGNDTISSYQSFRVRGMAATVSRNYFAWSIPTETALIERIEDSRGPNSVLFGIASPGGLINANTKQALLGRAFRKASFTVADRNSWRGALDVNQPVLKDRLSLRLNLIEDRNNSFRHYAFEDHHRGHLAINFRLTERTRLRAEYEHGQLDSNQPKNFTLTDHFLLWHSRGRPTYAALPSAAERTAAGLNQNAAAAAQPRVTYISNLDTSMAMRSTLFTTGNGNVIADERIADHSVNVGGPAQDRSSRFNALSAFVEHQFSKRTFLELAYNHQG